MLFYVVPPYCPSGPSDPKRTMTHVIMFRVCIMLYNRLIPSPVHIEHPNCMVPMEGGNSLHPPWFRRTRVFNMNGGWWVSGSMSPAGDVAGMMGIAGVTFPKSSKLSG